MTEEAKTPKSEADLRNEVGAEDEDRSLTNNPSARNTNDDGQAKFSDGIDPDMPNLFVNNSGDSNQMGRSEEEEIENNTDIDANNAKKADILGR